MSVSIVCSARETRSALFLTKMILNLISHYDSAIFMVRVLSLSSRFNHSAAELCLSMFRHLKLELLTQIPALNDGKYYYL